MANWSPDRQQAVQARCEAATKGPWHARTDAHVSAIVAKCEGVAVYGLDCLIYFMRRDYDCLPDTFERQKADALFTAHARQDLPDALAELAAKDAEIARLTTRSDEGHAAHAASFDALLKIAVVVQDGEVDSYDSLADKTVALIARQQADLTRIAEVEEKARRVFEFGCSCGAVFDSLEAHANHVALVHTGPDAKEAADG